MLLNDDVIEAFNLLSLPTSASEVEVRKQFKALAAKMHPDAGGSEENMKELNFAYELALKFIAQRKPEACICRGFVKNPLCKSSIHEETPTSDEQCPECGGSKKVERGAGFTKMFIDCPKCS